MEDGRGSSEIGSGKSIGLAEGILLPAEAVESNRSRPREVKGWSRDTLDKPVFSTYCATLRYLYYCMYTFEIKLP